MDPTISALRSRFFSSKKDIIVTTCLLLVLLLTIPVISNVIRIFSHGQETNIPASYSVLDYISTLSQEDKNDDGEINALDLAYLIKRYDNPYFITHPKFGSSVNSLELSFLIAQLDVSTVETKDELLKNPETARKYTEDIIFANEKKIAQPEYKPLAMVNSDTVLGESTVGSSDDESGGGNAQVGTATQSGGEGTGSKGADSGRTIIPSVLGTVAAYTGAAGFSYPVSVPSGPGGMAPAVGLSYSSGNVDDSLPYNDYDIIACNHWKVENNQWVCDEPVNGWMYKQGESYTPAYVGYGFGVGGAGAIIRDTRQEKDVYMLGEGQNQTIHHRFILNLPNGLSVQLKYNKTTGRWVSIPEGFVKIEHPMPENKADSRFDFTLVDPASWVITTSDGTKYYFGEEDLGARIGVDGRIKESENLTVKTTKKTHCDGNGNCEETIIDAVHHTITNNGGIYNEFDIADLCTGKSTSDPCRERIKKDHPALLVTKWLLKKVESSDGKAINYAYNNYQKAYGGGYFKKDWKNKLAFAAVDSYLKEINWNEGKHRVVFHREDRPDKGANQFLMPYRLSRIEVESRLPSDEQYHLVRRYDLNYVNDNSAMVPGAGNNDWNISLLKSIQEFGTDGKTTTPAITFTYRQQAFNTGASGSTIYLEAIYNGYGGVTTYVYEPFAMALFNPQGDPAPGYRRVRVVEKRVSDMTESPTKTFRETYDYRQDDRVHTSELGFADKIRGKKVSGREFLGHGQVEIKTYDFNSDKLLAHSKTRFYQIHGTWGDKTRKYNCDENHHCEEERLTNVLTCVEPHIAKGRPYEEIVYNQQKNGPDFEAQKTATTYRYRLLDRDTSGNIVIKQDNLDPSTKQCNGEEINEPYFFYTKATTVTANEVPDGNFVPFGLAEKLKQKPANQKTVKSENLNYDVYGNLLKAVAYGEVNDNGEPVDPKNNRYSYGLYITGNPHWLNNLPYATYSSNVENCTADADHDSCQYGKTLYWYDVFTGNFLDVKVYEQKPKLGYLTQKQTTIETDRNHDGSHVDPIVAYQGMEYLKLGDNQYGGVTKTYGPKPNITNAANPSSDIMLLGETTYDPYYHTLVTEQKNALGYKTVFEDFDYLLQAPRIAKKQLTKDKEQYTATKVLFDPLGRATMSFLPDPDHQGYAMGYPVGSFTYYFDPPPGGESQGLAVRTMSLTSQTKDGKYHYVASDQFYDGLGKVKQTQVLAKKVEGEPKRLVQDQVYNAAGNQEEIFEPQTAEPVVFGGDIHQNNYQAVMSSRPPQLVSIPHKVLSKTTYDSLNRPIIVTSFDVDNNFTFTTQSYYLVNAQKTVDNKGNITISTTDPLGRPSDSLLVDGGGDSNMLTQNEYSVIMLDKPTKTTYKSLKDLGQSGSTTQATITYDKAGRVLSTVEPSLGTASFTYDVLGNKLSEKRADGEDIRYQYDTLGRLVKTAYVGEKAGEIAKDSTPQDVVLTYDEGNYALGKLVAATYHNGRDDIIYDSAGRAKETTKTIKSKKFTSSTQYNTLSQVVGLSYPGGKKLTTEYDEDGVAQKTGLDGVPMADITLFNKLGKPTESEFVLGASTYLVRTPYDTMGRLKQIGVAKKISDGGNNLRPLFVQDLKYNQYAELTPILEYHWKDGAGIKDDFTFTYDSFSRLTKADSPLYNTSYTYDPFGRIQTKNEEEAITLSYNSLFPFFAPKSLNKPQKPEPTESPTPTPTAIPTEEPTPSTPLTASPIPSPTPTSAPGRCNAPCNDLVPNSCAVGLICTVTADTRGAFVCRNPKNVNDPNCGRVTPTPTARPSVVPSITIKPTATPNPTAIPTRIPTPVVRTKNISYVINVKNKYPANIVPRKFTVYVDQQLSGGTWDNLVSYINVIPDSDRSRDGGMIYYGILPNVVYQQSNLRVRLAPLLGNSTFPAGTISKTRTCNGRIVDDAPTQTAQCLWGNAAAYGDTLSTTFEVIFPTAPTPTATPTPIPTISVQPPTPTEIVRAGTIIPPRFTTPTPTATVTPTPTPAGCIFNPTAGIKEMMEDGTLRPLSDTEAANYLTINNKRQAKYDSEGNKKEFWQPFTDGFIKVCPEQGCDQTKYQGPNPVNHGYCCVDGKNYDDATQTGYGYFVNNNIDKARIILKYFGGTGDPGPYRIFKKYCVNKAGLTGCPQEDNQPGGLYDPIVPDNVISNLEIGCNKGYEYGWIVTKPQNVNTLLKLFPAKYSRAQEGTGTPIASYQFTYNEKGAMTEDDKHCFSYNRLSKLSKLSIKKDELQRCTQNPQFSKLIYFYYDAAGTLVLQEEYDPQDTAKPAKQTYFVGPYEEEYEYK